MMSIESRKHEDTGHQRKLRFFSLRKERAQQLRFTSVSAGAKAGTLSLATRRHH